MSSACVDTALATTQRRVLEDGSTGRLGSSTHDVDSEGTNVASQGRWVGRKSAMRKEFEVKMGHRT